MSEEIDIQLIFAIHINMCSPKKYVLQLKNVYQFEFVTMIRETVSCKKKTQKYSFRMPFILKCRCASPLNAHS